MTIDPDDLHHLLDRLDEIIGSRASRTMHEMLWGGHAAHEARFDQIDAHLADHDRRIDRLADRVEQLNDRVDRLDGRMDRLDGRMDRLEGRMDALQQEVSRYARVTVFGLAVLNLTVIGLAVTVVQVGLG